jgi:hypothetical protein
MVVGRTMVTLQLPADVAGAPQVTGVGVGLGTGVGVGDGDGVRVGDGDGDGDGDSDGLGDGEGDADGLAEGDGDGEGLGEGDAPGDGEAAGTTLIWTVAVACDEPDRATRLKLVVQGGVTCFVPLAVTVPTPLSISIVSAPSTSQLRVAAAPELMSAGDATNFWMVRPLGSVNCLTTPQQSAPIPMRTRRMGRRGDSLSIENPLKIGSYARYVK